MTSDLNVRSSRTNARPRTNRNTHGRRFFICWLKSHVPAVTPDVATSTPGRRPAIGGITVSRRVCNAAIDAALSLLPVIAKLITATVLLGLTVTVNGGKNWPVACARWRNSANALCIRGDVTFSDLTTIWAGVCDPGNA